MTHPWRRFALEHFIMLGQPRQVNSAVITARAEEKPRAKSDDATSIALGVIACLFLLSLVALGIFFFFRRRRQVIAATADVEKGAEKRNWWMVEGKEKSFSEWWRQSHSIPDRVEPPPSAGVRSSLQRIRSALTRKGALRGTSKKEDQDVLIPPVRIVSPSGTIDLPMQTVPQSKPRYPSVLERGYRVPLYPIEAPTDKSPPRSLTSPATHKPRSVAERSIQRQVTVPPRALSISKGRLVLPRSDRKVGLPRSPAYGRKHGMLSNIQHPFMPLKESETAFPTISAPMPSQETAATNPKLGYPQGTVQPVRAAPAAPAGPRVGRNGTRRVPAPLIVPSRPTTPASPLSMRETVIFPPGQSPSIRPTPVPL